jgi:molecular chaperone GrpE
MANKDNINDDDKNSSSDEGTKKEFELNNEKKESNNIEENVEEKLKVIEDKLLRTLAEVENQRRRFEKERKEAFEFGGFNFARESLSLIDNIDRAITSFKNDENLKKISEFNKIIDGIEIVKNDLISIFKKNNIDMIECINKKFDPNFHQAMMEIEDNTKEPGIVIQEIQKGYMMKNRLLRPSLVGIAKKRPENPENPEKVTTESKKSEKNK